MTKPRPFHSQANLIRPDGLFNISLPSKMRGTVNTAGTHYINASWPASTFTVKYNCTFPPRPVMGVLDEPYSAKPVQLSSHTGPPGYIRWTRFYWRACTANPLSGVS
jgi:hypothetical protein